KLPSFIPPFTSSLQKKYAADIIDIDNSAVVSWIPGYLRWQSSTISLFWEFGIIGFSLFTAFYLSVMRKGKNILGKIGGIAITPASYTLVVAYLVVVIFWDLWLEFPQFAVFHWMILGILSKYDYIHSTKKRTTL
ncbi:MAG: hypothetical protein IIC93_11050, partial [Chloroflexi bacterium]|nr:hypothetical protein [Chloroflexota bacterium]